MKENYLQYLREGRPMTTRQQIMMIVQLSLPAILAQLSHILMQYIDASMVGHLGSNESAAIGLVASSTWLFNGLCSAAVTGFTVQVAQNIGACRLRTARDIMKQAYAVVLAISLVMAALGALVSRPLPRLLGGDAVLFENSSAYFFIFALSLPVVQINNISGAMLQASGNMRLPSLLHIIMCGLDVVFNFFLIFPTRSLWGMTVPGAGLGVAGAALGTALAQLVTAAVMAYMLLARSEMLHLRRGEPLHFCREHLRQWGRLSGPIAVEQCILSGAQIVSTSIVAPLGTVSIAANSFAVTAESLCYMPGYGIGSAATTLIGQSTGAGRSDLTRRLGFLTTGLGMLVMGCSGALLYLGAPWMMQILSRDAAVIALGTSMLRIVAYIEPLYGASIVANGVFRGAGDTLLPSILNFGSMWLVRLPLASYLAPKIGLRGVWIAMAIELFVRGSLFLLRLFGKSWQRKGLAKTQ